MSKTPKGPKPPKPVPARTGDDFSLDLAEVARHRDQWIELAYSTAALDQTEVAAAVQDIYAVLYAEKPKIIICQSPFQLAFMPRICKAGGKLSRCLTDQFEDHLFRHLKRKLLKQLRSQLPKAVEQELEFQLGHQLDDLLRERLGELVSEQLWNDHHDRKVWKQPGSPLIDNLKRQVHRQLGDEFLSSIGDMDQYQDAEVGLVRWFMFLPWFESDLLAFLDYAQTLPGVNYDLKFALQLKSWIRLAKAIHGFVPYNNLCFVLERPLQLLVDGEGELRTDSDAALVYADGCSPLRVRTEPSLY